MALGRGGLLVAAVVGGIVGAMVGGALGGAAAVSPDAVGRFQMVAHGGGLVRIDTTTGEMMGCLANRVSWPGVACAITVNEFEDHAASFQVRAVQADIAAGPGRDAQRR